MSTQVTHHGRIVGIGDNHLIVRIETGADECATCAISKVCGKHEQLQIPYDHPTGAMVGRHIDLVMGVADRWRAMAMFMVIPVCLLILTLGVLLTMGMEQPVAGLWALAVVILWYLVVYLFRGKQKIKIRITE